MSQIELEREALQLSAKERAELARKLLQSLNEMSEEELEKLWAAEANERFAAFERGEIKAYSREEALKRVKAALS
jgi:putative addiction module component (TIGR02574 family)